MDDILCPNCQTPNRRGARYCTSCGLSLVERAEPTTLVMDEATLRGAVARPTVQLSGSRLPDITPRPPARSGNGTPTMPLGPPPAAEPLPEGALLAERYLIREQVEGPPGVFVYLAEDGSDNPPYGVACLIKESADETALAGELEAMRHIPPGDGVRPPYDAFTLTLRAASGPRVFVVGSRGQPFEALEWLVEPAAALVQAAPLARGLAAVHAAGLAFGGLAGQVQSDGELFLADFASLAAGTAATYDADVRALAGMIVRMLAGPTKAAVGAVAPADGLADVAAGRATMTAAELAALLSSRIAGLRRPESLDLRVGRRTDVGQLRELNEDSLLTLDLVWSNKSVSRPVGLFVVADGMGGHEGGEVASGLLVRAVAQHAASELLPRTTAAGGDPMDFGAWLTAAIQSGNVEVYERSQQAGNDMGTTVVAALVAGDEVYIAHVGDSRAYRINSDGIQQITVDHSLVESLVASNQITREEARHHPQSNVIYRTIGDKRQVTVDLDLLTLASHDSLLLCSDGLSGMLTDETIHRLVMSAASPQAACDALIDAANRAGGEDNITAIIIRAEALA